MKTTKLELTFRQAETLLLILKKERHEIVRKANLEKQDIKRLTIIDNILPRLFSQAAEIMEDDQELIWD